MSLWATVAHYQILSLEHLWASLESSQRGSRPKAQTESAFAATVLICRSALTNQGSHKQQAG